jgi:DNA-3-methyladenine glycosylase
MKENGGKILIYNVHEYKMLNVVTAEKGKPEAVLIRALETLNFKGRCCGPGLLTLALDIDDRFHGQDILKNKEMWLEEERDKIKEKEIVRAFRIGVRQDLPKKLRFYIKGNEHVSRI